jgi:hypothetical protein
MSVCNASVELVILIPLAQRVMDVPISCHLPAEVFERILYYRLRSAKLLSLASVDWLWHYTPLNRMSMLCVATCIISNVFPSFNASARVLTLSGTDPTPDCHGPSSTVSMTSQFAAFRMIALTYAYNPFSLQRMKFDLRQLDNHDPYFLHYLKLIRHGYTLMHLADPVHRLPALELFLSQSSPELMSLLSHLGTLGITALSVGTTVPYDGELWNTGIFFSAHFCSLTSLCLQGTMLQEDPTFIARILRQETVTHLELLSFAFSRTDWRFILYSISMPNLCRVMLQGRFHSSHIDDFFRRHNNIRSFKFGLMSRWLDHGYPMLQVPTHLEMIEGPHDMIAPLFEANSSIGALRHICLHPSTHPSTLGWDSDSLEVLFDLISESVLVANLAVYIDYMPFAQLAQHLNPTPPRILPVKHLTFVHGPRVGITHASLVRKLVVSD